MSGPLRYVATLSNLAQQQSTSQREAVVYAPSFFRDDDALLGALLQGQRGARAVFFRRHVDDVELLLTHLLGQEGSELVQAVFSDAFVRICKYDGEADELGGWVLGLAVVRAERLLTRRRFWSRLWPKAGAAAKRRGLEKSSPQQAMYQLLHSLVPKRSIMLALHWIAELPIEEVAMLCDESLVTVRQQLLTARAEFLELAWGHDDLRPWICNVVSRADVS